MAPLTVTFLGALVGAGSSTAAGEGGAGFVGDHIISVSRIMNPNMSLKVWERNFQGSQVGELMPFYLVTLCALLLGVYLHVTNRQQLMERRAILSLMSLYFTPILLVTLLATGDAQPRYLLHVLPIGYVLIALGLWVIYRDAPIRKLSGYVSLRTVATLLAAFPFLIYGLQAATWRMETPSSDPDFFAAMEYVRDNREDGDAIIVSLPTTAHFAFDQATIKNDLYFLAGPEERSRSNRYTRPLADGSRVDYWLGMPSIVSTGQLCEVLASHGDRTWFIVDEDRLNASWAYRGPMSEVIQGSSKLVAQGQGGSRVFRVRPLSEWSEQASKHCTTIQAATPAPVDAATPAPR